MPVVNCDRCGKFTHKYPYQLEKYSNHYCSNECRLQARTESLKENPPRESGGQEEIKCDNCGDIFEEYESQRTYDNKFCSEDCLFEWLSESRTGGGPWKGHTGEDHPTWTGYDTQYGEEWYIQRQKALHRDNHQCQECGLRQDECRDKNATGLHVHHIVPYRTFDDDEEAHRLDNLVTLCPPCHRAAEEKT